MGKAGRGMPSRGRRAQGVRCEERRSKRPESNRKPEETEISKNSKENSEREAGRGGQRSGRRMDAKSCSQMQGRRSGKTRWCCGEGADSRRWKEKPWIGAGIEAMEEEMELGWCKRADKGRGEMQKEHEKKKEKQKESEDDCSGCGTGGFGWGALREPALSRSEEPADERGVRARGGRATGFRRPAASAPDTILFRAAQTPETGVKTGGGNSGRGPVKPAPNRIRNRIAGRRRAAGGRPAVSG